MERNKVYAVLETLNDFTEEDFRDLAVACADQAGMRVDCQQAMHDNLTRAIFLARLRQAVAS